MKIEAPIEVKLKVHITNGILAGVATIGLGKGKYPTESELREAVANFELESMPDGFRLMTKREWLDEVCPTCHKKGDNEERISTRSVIPGSDEYDL